MIQFRANIMTSGSLTVIINVNHDYGVIFLLNCWRVRVHGWSSVWQFGMPLLIKNCKSLRFTSQALPSFSRMTAIVHAHALTSPRVVKQFMVNRRDLFSLYVRKDNSYGDNEWVKNIFQNHSAICAIRGILLGTGERVKNRFNNENL